MEAVAVVGGSGSGKDDVVNAGDLLGEEVGGGIENHRTPPGGVRVAIVAKKSGNADGAKDDRKANSLEDTRNEIKSPIVPIEGDKQGEEDLWQRYGAERLVWSPKMMAALEKGIKGNKWFSLMDKVQRLEVLELAWRKVQSKAGACGVDGIRVEHFAKDSQSRLLAVKEQLEKGSYQPQLIKRVWIPKPGGTEQRPLGIPTVRDRVVQSAIRMVIEPIFEREFAPQSYGFRPGRSCRDALRRVDELLKKGYRHVVDIDIKGYFDAIPRERLMKLVEERIADGAVLQLIEAILKQKVIDSKENWEWEPEKGTPQGGVISPLLANVYLNPLDWLLAHGGIEMVRYADDIVVLCKRPEQAIEALEQIRAWMRGAELELHPEKTRIVAMTEAGRHFDFLGYRFWAKKNGRIGRYVRPKSRKKLRERIKPLTKRNNGSCLQAIVGKVNPILKGWYSYFKHASVRDLREIDHYVRGRLRGILRKRDGLKGRGRGRDHQRWNNATFTKLGLFNLKELHTFETAILRYGAKC